MHGEIRVIDYMEREARLREWHRWQQRQAEWIAPKPPGSIGTSCAEPGRSGRRYRRHAGGVCTTTCQRRHVAPSVLPCPGGSDNRPPSSPPNFYVGMVASCGRVEALPVRQVPGHLVPAPRTPGLRDGSSTRPGSLFIIASAPTLPSR